MVSAVAMLAGLLASCTKDSASNEAPLEVGFANPVVETGRTKALSDAATKALSDAATKAVAGEIPATYSIKEDFRVWSWYSTNTLSRLDATTNGSTANGTYFFENIKAFHTGSSLDFTEYWRLTPAYYWPKAGYLSFHAVSPADFASYCNPASGDKFEHNWGSSAAPGLKLYGYTVEDDPTKQIDLMYSDFVFNKRRSDYNDNNPYDDKEGDDKEGDDNTKYVYNGVNVLFHHAQSSVHFKVGLDRDYEIVGGRIRLFLKKLEVLYPYKKADFSENRKPDNLKNEYASGSGPVWSNQQTEKDSYVLYNKGSITGGTLNAFNDIAMKTNGTWHVAHNINIEKGVEIVFRRGGSWEDVLGHIKGQAPPYVRGQEFTVTDAGGTEINILDSGTYDILLNPGEKKARIIEAQPESAYAAFTYDSEWGIHYTLGFKPTTTAYDLVDGDTYGNKYIGGTSLLMIPQDLDHTAASGHKVQARITYSVKVGNVEVETTVTKDLPGLLDSGSTAINSWLPGRKYVYTITLGMDKIIVDPYVTAWVNVDDIGK